MDPVTLPDDKPFKPATELVSPALRAAFRSWQQLAGERFAPARKDLVPSRFRDVLNSIFLMEVIDAGKDFRFALGGEKLVRFMDGRHAGKLLSEMPENPYYTGMRIMFSLCIQMAAPVARGPFRVMRDAFDSHLMEVLIMPLSSDGKTLTDLLGVVDLKQQSIPSAKSA